MGDKLFKTLDQLKDVLTDERGLVVPNPDELKSYIARVNYYRFSGYAREFQIDPRYGDNRFVKGTTFEEIREIMEIDSKMRSLLLRGLSSIEVATRSLIAHEYSRAYGETAFYLDSDFYNDSANPNEDKPNVIVSGILSDLERDKSNMVSRYVDRSIDGDDLGSRLLRYANVPIWVAVELVSFGRVSNLIAYAKDPAPAKAAAAHFKLQWAPFAEVIHSLSVLRNLCAHQRQLWNRKMGILCPVQKKLKPRNVRFNPTSAYCQVLMMNHYISKIDDDASVAAEIEALLDSNSTYAKGFMIPSPK